MTTWSDDFTSPTLHPRWTVQFGTYSPPGIGDMDIHTPVTDQEYEFTYNFTPNSGNGRVSIVVDHTSSGHLTVSSYADGRTGLSLGVFFRDAPGPAGGTLTIRKKDGQYSVLRNGEVLTGSEGPLSVSDGDRTPTQLMINSYHPNRVHWVSYTSQFSPPLPSNAFTPEDIHTVHWGMDEADALYNGSTLIWEAPALSITTASLSSMTLGSPFSQGMVTNFTPISWSATGLPAGISINTSTGLISGTPSSVSSGTATITATKFGGRTAQRSFPWQVVQTLVSVNAPFDSTAQMQGQFPIRGFDGRTASNSPRNEGWCFSGMLVAGDNSAVTHWNLLIPDEINAEDVEWQMVMGNAMNTVARPTEIILSSDINFSNQLLLQIGSGNLNLVWRTTGGTTNLRTLSRTIGNGSLIRVRRSGLSTQVWHGTTSVYTYTGTTSNASSWFRTVGRGYTGISMFSTSGQWSSRVDNWSVEQLA